MESVHETERFRQAHFALTSKLQEAELRLVQIRARLAQTPAGDQQPLLQAEQTLSQVRQTLLNRLEQLEHKGQTRFSNSLEVAELDRLRAELELERRSIEKIRSERDEALQQLASQRLLVERVESLEDELIQSQRELTSAQRVNEQSTAQLQVAFSQLQQKQDQILLLEDQLKEQTAGNSEADSLRQSLRAQTEEIARLSQLLDQLQDQIQSDKCRLERQELELQLRCQELQQSSSAVQQVREHTEDVVEQNALLQGELLEGQQREAELQGENANLRLRILSLENLLETSRSQNHQRQLDEDEDKLVLQRQLSDSKKHYERLEQLHLRLELDLAELERQRTQWQEKETVLQETLSELENKLQDSKQYQIQVQTLQLDLDKQQVRLEQAQQLELLLREGLKESERARERLEDELKGRISSLTGEINSAVEERTRRHGDLVALQEEHKKLQLSYDRALTQRAAAVAQYNIIRDEAANLRQTWMAEMETELSNRTEQKVREIDGLDGDSGSRLERLCQLWLEAEQRADRFASFREQDAPNQSRE